MLVIAMLVVILLSAVGLVVWLWSQLQKGTQAFEEKSVEPLADIKTMRPLQPFDEERKAFEQEIAGLKQELDTAQARGREQERTAAEIMTDLRSQCDTLRRNVIELESSSAATASVEQEGVQLDHLRAENSAFRSQIDESVAENRQLKEGVARLQQENERIKGADVQSEGVQNLVDVARQEYQHQMECLYKEIEQLRKENTQLQQQTANMVDVPDLRRAMDELSGKVQELESSGALLLEKNEYLQYELTKSRAEVIGLERLCENADVMMRGLQAEAGVAGR